MKEDPNHNCLQHTLNMSTFGSILGESPANSNNMDRRKATVVQIRGRIAVGRMVGCMVMGLLVR